MTPFERADAALLPGFRRVPVETEEGRIMALVGGEGPPVLMLHGDPQTHLCWHLIAPRLTDRFTVVLTDLRGRGESHMPGVTPGHAAYSKRRMAAEQHQVMAALGFERYRLVAHDRGARVAMRLAVDHPEAVDRLCVMDIVPTLDLYDRVTAEAAQDYFYFFFLTQPYPRPEHWIAGDADGFLRDLLCGLGSEAPAYAGQALELYLEMAARPASVTTMCECFRAGITCDLVDDRASRDRGDRIDCPTLVIWGENGVIGRHYDIPGIWRQWASNPEFLPVPSGHFVPEEAPDAVFDRLRPFLLAA